VSHATTRSAPAVMPVEKTFLRYSKSARVASSAESSTVKPQSLAWRTMLRVMSSTSARVFFSFASMWRSETGMMRWMLSAPAFATASMSVFTPREALQISALKPASAMSFTASSSPSETAANPASITSTPSSSSLLAMRSLFSGVKDTPGVCSPSRRVVSKTLIFSGKRLDKTIPHFPSHSNQNRESSQHIKFTIPRYNRKTIANFPRRFSYREACLSDGAPTIF
jgi:hypothetical protein